MLSGCCKGLNKMALPVEGKDGVLRFLEGLNGEGWLPPALPGSEGGD